MFFASGFYGPTSLFHIQLAALAWHLVYKLESFKGLIVLGSVQMSRLTVFCFILLFTDNLFCQILVYECKLLLYCCKLSMLHHSMLSILSRCSGVCLACFLHPVSIILSIPHTTCHSCMGFSIYAGSLIGITSPWISFNVQVFLSAVSCFSFTAFL
jgi:hypothetical protein